MLLTMILLLWLKNAYSNLAGSCMTQDQGFNLEMQSILLNWKLPNRMERLITLLPKQRSSWGASLCNPPASIACNL